MHQSNLRKIVTVMIIIAALCNFFINIVTFFFNFHLNYPCGLRTFALIVCAQRYCAGNATVICHALLRALVKLRFQNLCKNRGR